jgi:hypothetical protein
MGYRELQRSETKDGLPQLFATNTLAPYVLTALIEKPQRLIAAICNIIGIGEITLAK